MDQGLKEKIDQKIQSSRLFLFMKGTPTQPMCGFSAGVVEVLGKLGVSYGSCNVLEDQSIRQGIKEYSNWPTIPQLYVDGEFIGGYDIVVDMSRSGELQRKLGI